MNVLITLTTVSSVKEKYMIRKMIQWNKVKKPSSKRSVLTEEMIKLKPEGMLRVNMGKLKCQDEKGLEQMVG